jgi:hypothetical protein
MKPLRYTLGLVVLTLVFMFALQPAANADAPVTVSNGTAWTSNAVPTAVPQVKGLGDYCTMGVVGTDASGNKVGITAAHCVSQYEDGDTVYLYATTAAARIPIGTIAHRDTAIDYVVIKFGDNVTLSSNGPGARVDGIGPANVQGRIACKDGQTSGVSCGFIYGQDANVYFSTGYALPGDSGGPLFVNNTKWVGLVHAVYAKGFEYTKSSTILNDIAAGSNSVGKGLVVTNN